MSAGALASARNERQQNSPSTRAGYTAISTATMHHLVVAVAAEACSVPTKDVRANLHDEQGQLSVSLAVPLTPGVPTNDGYTVFERAAAARVRVTARIHELADTAVRRVDICYTGILGADQAEVGRVQ